MKTKCEHVAFNEDGMCVSCGRHVATKVQAHLSGDCAARKALEAIQWGNEVYDPNNDGSGTVYTYNLCPMCEQSAVRGHAPDCLVGMALASPCVPAPCGMVPGEDSGSLAPTSRTPEQTGQDEDSYVAWLRYRRNGNRTWIAVCDSDSDGAFKVFRHPSAPCEECAKHEQWLKADSQYAEVERLKGQIAEMRLGLLHIRDMVCRTASIILMPNQRTLNNSNVSRTVVTNAQRAMDTIAAILQKYPEVEVE